MSYQPLERMTEEELAVCEICFIHARYPPRPYRDKPEISRLTKSLRSAYAEIDALHIQRASLLAVIERELDQSETEAA